MQTKRRNVCVEWYGTVNAAPTTSKHRENFSLPGVLIRLKTVVLRYPRVDLDATPLLLPKESPHEGPGHLEWVRRVHRLHKNLVWYYPIMPRGGESQIHRPNVASS